MIALLLLLPAHALGQSAVEEGRRFYEEAEFLEALDAFATAESADDLTREELVTLFETRALVHLAMGNAEPMRGDLARLVALAPEHVLDRRAPPDVRRTFAELRAASQGPIRLRAHPSAAAAGVTVEAEAENDTQSLVRSVRIHGRTDAGAWESAVDAPLFVALTEEAVIEYWAEAVGPGGVVLASSGSADEPLRFSGAAATPGSEEDTGGDDGVLIGVVVAVVAALLVASGIATTVLLLDTNGGSDQTIVRPFTVRF